MAERLHIGFISHEYPLFGAGGAGRHVQVMARNLVKLGQKVTVFGILPVAKPTAIDDEGVRIKALPPSKIPKGKFMHNALRLQQTIKETHRKDPLSVLEGADLDFAFLPRQLANKYVVHMHGGHLFFAHKENRKPTWWKTRQEKRSYAKADAFIAPTRHAGKLTMELHNRDIKFSVIPYALDERWLTNLAGSASQNHHPLRNLLFVGTLCRKKGVEELLKALEILLPTYPELTLTLAGPDWYQKGLGSFRKYLEKNFASSLLKHVHFRGRLTLEALKEAYQQADICIFPSHAETFGIVAIEAMAMGKPLIFTEKKPGPEIVKHQHTGLLCNPHDPNDIAIKTKQLIENPQLANTLAKTGQSEVEDTYHPIKIANRLLQFYQNLHP